MTQAKWKAAPNRSTRWSSYVPNAKINIVALHALKGSGWLAFASRVKAMHHWIRKGNADKAANSARAAAHVANAVLRLIAKEPTAHD